MLTIYSLGFTTVEKTLNTLGQRVPSFLQNGAEWLALVMGFGQLEKPSKHT